MASILRGRRGRDGHVDDRDAVRRSRGGGCAVDHLVGLAELGDRGGLAGAGGAGQDQAAAGADRRAGSAASAACRSVTTCRSTEVAPPRRGGCGSRAGPRHRRPPGVVAEGRVLGCGQEFGLAWRERGELLSSRAGWSGAGAGRRSPAAAASWPGPAPFTTVSSPPRRGRRSPAGSPWRAARRSSCPAVSGSSPVMPGTGSAGAPFPPGCRAGTRAGGDPPVPG